MLYIRSFGYCSIWWLTSSQINSNSVVETFLFHFTVDLDAGVAFPENDSLEVALQSFLHHFSEGLILIQSTVVQLAFTSFNSSASQAVELPWDQQPEGENHLRGRDGWQHRREWCVLVVPDSSSLWWIATTTKQHLGSWSGLYGHHPTSWGSVRDADNLRRPKWCTFRSNQWVSHFGYTNRIDLIIDIVRCTWLLGNVQSEGRDLAMIWKYLFPSFSCNPLRNEADL